MILAMGIIALLFALFLSPFLSGGDRTIFYIVSIILIIWGIGNIIREITQYDEDSMSTKDKGKVKPVTNRTYTTGESFKGTLEAKENLEIGRICTETEIAMRYCKLKEESPYMVFLEFRQIGQNIIVKFIPYFSWDSIREVESESFKNVYFKAFPQYEKYKTDAEGRISTQMVCSGSSIPSLKRQIIQKCSQAHPEWRVEDTNNPRIIIRWFDNN